MKRLCIALAFLTILIAGNVSARQSELDKIELLRKQSDVPTIHAVQFIQSFGRKTIISYSILDGKNELLVPLAFAKQMQTGNTRINLFTSDQVDQQIAGENFFETLTSTLQQSLQQTWPEFAEYTLSIELHIVPEGVKIKDEYRSAVKNNKLHVRYYFRERDFTDQRYQMGIARTLSHELYHLFYALFAPHPPKTRLKRSLAKQKYHILNESAASIYDACFSLELVQKATIRNDALTHVNGRQGTMDDAELNRLLTTKKNIPENFQSAIGVALFHTVWVSVNGQNWDMLAETDAGQYFRELCNQPGFGTLTNIEAAIEVIASDGVDAMQLENRPQE
ncbi:MAG: hypothetical protein JKX99_08080 [Robiginitomaculum sp.]|nr:hypothetical protein [Robiginitomaculum sp.]